MLIQKLEQQKLVQPPKWLSVNTHYLTIMGSDAYGVSSGSSDIDIYGFCIPPKEIVFPHLAGKIDGFGEQFERFGQWQQHHVKTLDGTKEYDFSVYSIVKYIDLCMSCNPNMIDSLFTPTRCVVHMTHIGDMVRSRRKDFLHKGAWHKFKGYSYSQMAKIEHKENKESSAISDLKSFEKNHDIPHVTSYQDVLDEINRRGLKS